MPSRVPVSRSARALASTRASSAVEVADEVPPTVLRLQICALFRDSQKSTAGHRKLVINMRKIQEACCYEPQSRAKKTGAEDYEESEFNDEIVRCVLRVMPVKRSEAAGERVIRFIGLFLKHANEKDNELISEEEALQDILIETPSTRLTNLVMKSVLPLLTAKEKFVRFRSTQLISHLVNSLDSMDDELFQLLRQGLLRRIRDKEAMVRVQAVLGLGRLAGNEGDDAQDSDDSDDEASGGLLDKLLDVLQNDPSADVRRSLLVNLPILPNTLPYLLERARDQDPATRRALYSRLLPALGDFRHLSLSMREKLLRWGLRDRDENVRKAAAKLFRERWIEDCAGIPEEPLPAGELSPPNFDGLTELLERIDIVNSGVENGVAIEAMKGFWEGRADYREAVVFDELFWDTLSAESVFIARSFNDFCRGENNSKLEALCEEKMPEVTKLAYYLQRYVKVLVDALQRVAMQEDGGEEEEEDTVEQEFIVEQLLHIANSLDYSDEVGRRKMFALLRQSLTVPDLPEEVTKLIVEVLRGICASDAAGEREFVSVVLEAVADIHDTIMDEPTEAEADEEDSFHSARSELADGTATGPNKGKEPLTEEEEQDKAIREIMVNMKCLHIVQCMLQNVEGNLQQNVDMVAMLNNLVVPAVRSHEAPVRERGLLCLGLCSLLDKSLAEENLSLFMHFFAKGHTALQITALQILTDILTQHGSHLIEANPPLLKVYLKALKSNKGPEVQAAATVSVCKLLLGRVIQDSEATSDLLKTLIVAYFDPATQGNQGVRQALSYFLPVFCYSRAENQERVGAVAVGALHQLFNVSEGYDDEEEEKDMVSLSVIGAHLVDWTDPRKCYTPGHTLASMEAGKKDVPGDVHVDLAFEILEKLQSSCTKEEKKILAPLLGKLHISPAASGDKLRELHNEVDIAVESKLVSDATGRNAMVKLQGALNKIVNALGDRAIPQTTTTRESGSPEIDADTPIESTEIQEEEESLAQETSQLSLAETAASIDPEDLREDTYDEDDAAALMNQLNAEATRAEESILLDDSVMEDSVMDETREASVLSLRPKRGIMNVSQQPQSQSGITGRGSRARDSLVNELLSDDSGEETL